MNMAWVQLVPKQWQTVRLKSAVDLKSIRENGSSFSENYVGLERIESWTGRLLAAASDKGQSEDGESETKGMISHFEAGDILFGKLRPYLAKAHLAQEAGVCTTELLVLKPRDYVDGKFLLNTILTREFIGHVNAETFGVKMPRADWDTIGGLTILLPPISKQQEIADYLDRETQKIDSLIAAKKRLLELLAEKRRSMITQAVTRGLTADVSMKDSAIEYLGDVPKHWNIKPLKYLSSFISGATPDKGNKEYWDGTVPWISPKDMKKEYLLTSSELITDLALKETGIKLVEPPAILVVVRGMILLHSFPVAISTNPTTINQDMKALKCRHNILPDFLARQLQSRRDEILTMTRESGHGTKAIETTLLENLEIVIPPLDEQEAITKYMDKKFIQIDLLVDSTKKTIALLQERRTSLISAAVTGQLLIPD
jgi:type I restriction enzyme, S subunit